MAYPRIQSPEAWAQQLDFASIEHAHGLAPGVLVKLVRQESHGNCDIFSRVGAQGLCQFMPCTAQQLKVDASDPVSSINGAARYLEILKDRFHGDMDKAIAAYNCGPGNVDKAIAAGGETNWRQHLPNETKGYLRAVSTGSSDDGLTPEEEAQRRRHSFIDLGGSTNSPLLQGNSILGTIFYMIMQPLIDKFIERMNLPNGQAIASTAQGMHLADGSSLGSPSTPHGPRAQTQQATATI